MTIDEAIKKMEDLSEKQYKLSEISLHQHAKEVNHKNAEDSRQIANWLQELKAYRSIWNKIIDEIEEEIAKSELEEYPDYNYSLGLDNATEIIKKYFHKEKIADKEND